MCDVSWIDPKQQMPPDGGRDEDNAVWIWCKDGVCLGKPITAEYWWCTEWDAGIPGNEVYGWQPLNRPTPPEEANNA